MEQSTCQMITIDGMYRRELDFCIYISSKSFYTTRISLVHLELLRVRQLRRPVHVLPWAAHDVHGR